MERHNTVSEKHKFYCSVMVRSNSTPTASQALGKTLEKNEMPYVTFPFVMIFIMNLF
jgi:hypothetical protein